MKIMWHHLSLILITLVVTLTLFIAPYTQAQTPTPTEEPPDISKLVEFLGKDNNSPVFSFLTAIGYAIAIIGIVYAGVLYLTAFGSEDKPALAKKAVTAVITGLAIIVLSRVIVYSIAPDNNNDSIINTGLTET